MTALNKGLSAPGSNSPAALQLDLPLFDSSLPASTAAPSSGSGRRILLGGQWVDYALVRVRRRSIGFLIDDQGLRVSAPKWVTLGQIESALQDKSSWILRKIVEWREHAKRQERLSVRWEDGGLIAHLGRPLTLRSDPLVRGVQLDPHSDTLRVGLPPQAGATQLRDAVQAWMQSQARILFDTRLKHWTPRLGVHPSRWQLSSARTRWGSCTAQGAIRLNWRLIHFPLDIIDYVIVHELAHLKEMNHSPRFWATVQSVLPEFDQIRRQLKDFPDDLHLS
jgi:predicted metal-dependent hydrolase